MATNPPQATMLTMLNLNLHNNKQATTTTTTTTTYPHKMHRHRRRRHLSTMASPIYFYCYLAIIGALCVGASNNTTMQQQQRHQQQGGPQQSTLLAPTSNQNNNSDITSAATGQLAAAQPLEQVARAEALTGNSAASAQQQQQSMAASAKLFEVCKMQSRTNQHITNLSQIVFQPSDVCSSWHKMQRTQIVMLPNDAQSASLPWYHIEELNLSHNNLTVLHDSSGLNKMINLLELKITHNQLVRCEESSLAGLQRLQAVDLSHNKLMALPAKFFQHVQSSLKRLNLSFNSISVLVPTLFDSLTSLEYLDLSHNDITSHWINDRLFKNLTQLHYLDLSFNKLTVFSSPSTFNSLLQLETLSLQHNELRQVPETIMHLRYLSSLDLSQNSIHDITNASYLSNCRLLFNLNLASNLIDNITRDAFSDLPALKVLNLANNRIQHLDQQAFDYVPDLHALRLDSNRLIDFGQAFVNLRFLLMLNISSNRITSFDYGQIPLGLQWLDLHSNKIDKLNNFYYSPTAQQSLSVNDIQQQSGSPATTISQQWQSMLRLTTLDASYNLIKELDNTSLPESLETVQLNNNQIKSIASHTFSSKSNLTRINLSHNQLSTLPLDAIKLHGQRDSVATTTTTTTVLSSSSSVSSGSANGNKLVDIYMANNPFVCNCLMGWFSQLLLASYTLQPQQQQQQQHHHHGQHNGGAALREHQLILARQLPRIADAHLISCHLPFARQSAFANIDSHQWSPVMAANQLALQQQLQQQQHQSASALISRQSELLASVHLCPYKSHCFALCYCCDFDACDCEMSCPENCSCYYDQTWSTNIVDCSANNQIHGSGNAQQRLVHHLLQQQPTAAVSSGSKQPVRFVNIPDKIPMDVTELYLDGLDLLHLRANALIGRKNLKSLFLNNSQLYSIEPKALATQKALRVLQLNSNHLTQLHGHEFELLDELRELYLAHNQLSSIANTTFASLKSLQILHLQDNQLYHLNFWSNLPASGGSSSSGIKLLQQVNLGFNPWSCQCDHVEPMLQWLHLNFKHVHDRKSVTCQYNKTSALHLLSPLLGGPADNSAAAATIGLDASTNENYPMFDMRMCLNHTVYAAAAPASQPPLQLDYGRAEPRDYAGARMQDTATEFNIYANTNNNNSISAPILVPNIMQPNDEPFQPGQRAVFNSGALDGNIVGAGNNAAHQSSDMFGLGQDALLATGGSQAANGGYQFPPASSRASAFSSSFVLGLASMTLVLIVLILSLIHYRRNAPRRRPLSSSWLFSRYGLSHMFSASAHTKSHHASGGGGGHPQHTSNSAAHLHAGGVGSLVASGKHLHHQHHHHQHLHAHCGVVSGAASTAGSTSSSSAASSNLSQALCSGAQQAASSIANPSANGLATTPLIVTNSNFGVNHHHQHHHSQQQLLNSATTTTTTTTTSSPYNDDDKLFDAYLTYSKHDEQFINDYIAPELEYGQPSYRVALHYRDSPPATTSEILTDFIIDSANASRRIVMILSEQFLKTEWTQYEFRTALLDALRGNHRQRLIVVLLGQPSSFSAILDADMLQWLKTCTCVQWGDKMFWQRLRFAMPELPFAAQQPQYLRYQTLGPYVSRQQQQQQQQQQRGQQQHMQQNVHPLQQLTQGGNKPPKQSNFTGNLLKSAGGLLSGSNRYEQQQQHRALPMQQQQVVTTSRSLQHALNRPLPQPGVNQTTVSRPVSNIAAEEHHYAHLTPSTMIYNQQQQQQHTYHQPIYGDPQQAVQQQQQQQQQQQSKSRDNPTVPVHI